MKFNVDVARRTAGFADLTDTAQVNALSRFDTGRDVNVECCAGPNASVSGTRRAGSRNDGSVSTARPTRSRCNDVPQKAANLTLDRPAPATHITARRVGTGRTTRSLTRVAHDGGVNLDFSVIAENHVNEFDVDAKQGVVSALGTRLRATGLTSAEERVEDVAHVPKTGHPAKIALTTHVVIATLFSITQHVVGVCHGLESFLGALL
jgi:hypothetical protein